MDIKSKILMTSENSGSEAKTYSEFNCKEICVNFDNQENSNVLDWDFYYTEVVNPRRFKLLDMGSVSFVYLS